ncbi:PF06674 domain protein [Leptospira interrogans serovar Canicola]|nr:PF06674 domain protein [Leptospira interrogans serovar Copenhageni/Icterohaemorrhagiae]OCC28239.1 PF06674 domain protein [Leptospira interrogans serovar Canicola]
MTQKSGFKRTSIHWPKDCDFIAHIPEERNKYPELICADALDQLRAQLPNDCQYNELALGEDGFMSYHLYADFLGYSPIQFFSTFRR